MALMGLSKAFKPSTDRVLSPLLGLLALGEVGEAESALGEMLVTVPLLTAPLEAWPFSQGELRYSVPPLAVLHL
jgi:hypothetical protein